MGSRKSAKIQQCGLCARWTRNGNNVPSGNRDPETGITPMDNFVCWHCQQERRGFNLLGKAADKWLRDHPDTGDR
jgi:hypothetical protein